MKKWGIIVTIILICAGISCGNNEKKEDENLVIVTTPYGVIKIKLYEKTTEHRKNFEKLVSEGFYNGLLFHRVIPDFMIQGGDPDSRNAGPEVKLGGGVLEYDMPAEIFPEYYHKRGAVAAARRGGIINIAKRSSGSQFYIVQGEKYTEADLDTLEMAKNQHLKNEMVRQLLMASEKELKQYQENKDRENFVKKVTEIRDHVDSLIQARNLALKYTPEQRKIYTTIGGYPSLDGDYTVFGEVVEGMDVVDKIASVETDKNDRPLKNIEMKMEMLK